MTAPTLTAQEVFDIAVGGVLKQGAQCLDEHGLCVYRGPNGTKCAAGFVFTDDEIAGCNASADIVIEYRAPRLRGYADLLFRLQLAHDSRKYEDFCSGFADRARKTAWRFGLSTAVIDQWEASQ